VSLMFFTKFGVFEMIYSVATYMFDSFVLYCPYAQIYLTFVLVYHMLVECFHLNSVYTMNQMR